MNRTNLLSLWAMALLICLSSSCKKDDGTNPDPDPDPDPSTEPIILECRYDQNVTLKNHNPLGVDYIATCAIEVYDGTMTIEPGTTIAFESGTFIDVDIDGGLSAVGTASDPILFTSLTGSIPSWKGIFIATENAFNRLEHCVVENAGSSTLSVLHGPAGVAVWNKGSFVNTTFRNCGGPGLLVYGENSDITEFASNTFTANQTYALEVDISQVSSMDFTFCVFSNNGADKILLNEDTDRLYDNHTWVDAGVPYVFSNNLDLYGDLTLEEGVHIQMGSGLRLSTANENALTINGKANNPVIIEGEEDFAGYWDGIEIRSASVKNIFSYLTIRNGGAEALTWNDQKGNIGVWGNMKLTIDHLVSESTPECDIVLQNAGTVDIQIEESPNIQVCED